MSEEFDPTPPQPSVRLTLIPAAVAVGAAAVVFPAAALAAIGAVAMGLGVRRGSRRLHTAGGTLTFGGVLLAALAGGAPGLALLGGAGAIVAWDAGEHAVGVGKQVGNDARARPGLFVHVGATAVAGVVIVVLTAIVFVLASGGQPGAAAGVLALAAGIFALLLDR